MADRLKQDAYLVDPTDGTASRYASSPKKSNISAHWREVIQAHWQSTRFSTQFSPAPRFWHQIHHDIAGAQLLLECGIGICAAAGSCRAPLAGLVNRVRERGGIGRCDELVVEPPDDEERDSPPEPDTNSNGRGNYDGGDEDG